MDLIDIGCNLTHDSFAKDRDEVISQAREAGVVQLVVTGASEQGSVDASELAQAYPGRLFATAGIHPHHAAELSADAESVLRELVIRPEVRAAGETGLDYFRDFCPRAIQRTAFERQLQIGVDSGLPMFLHQRDAHDDFVAILRLVRDQLGEVVVHCFTGSQPEMHQLLDLGCHIGITGWICDERRGTHMKKYLGEIPPDKVMIETDSPYLKPRNIRPKIKSHRNEPRLLPWIAGTLAAARGETPEALADMTTRNARRFFDLTGDVT